MPMVVLFNVSISGINQESIGTSTKINLLGSQRFDLGFKEDEYMRYIFEGYK